MDWLAVESTDIGLRGMFNEEDSSDGEETDGDGGGSG